MKMALGQRPMQRLILTQPMEQSIKILEMDKLDLQAYIHALSIENPVVDLDGEPDADSPWQQRKKKLEWLDALTKNDRQNTGYYDQTDYSPEQAAAPVADTLEAYLMEQAALNCSKELYPTVALVIGFVDENGYLRGTTEELLKRAKCDPLVLERAIACVQSFEPAGVGARNVAECLLLQLPLQDAVARRIASAHLEDLVKGRLPYLAKALGVSIEEAERAGERIRRLNPKPGSGFGSSLAPLYVTPDVIVTQRQDGYDVTPCDCTCPTLNLSRSYIDLIRQTDDKEIEAYIEKKMKQAQWVQKCIQQRIETLLAVTQSIVQHQERFFRAGPRYMTVLRMSDVAAGLGVHESTVSRAVKSKYLQCAHGLFPLKHFFVQGVGAPDGADVASSHELKCQIRSFISGENKSRPLSDQQIALMLEERGVRLSRRTVAKYREQMRIPKSCYRKA